MFLDLKLFESTESHLCHHLSRMDCLTPKNSFFWMNRNCVHTRHFILNPVIPFLSDKIIDSILFLTIFEFLCNSLDNDKFSINSESSYVRQKLHKIEVSSHYDRTLFLKVMREGDEALKSFPVIIFKDNSGFL